MIVAIHQPGYFPWLGLLHKIAGSDALVVMDEVQLSDSLYQHRNLFLTAQGEAKYLSIPFVRKGYLQRRFRDIELADPAWASRHRDFLHANYRRHPAYGEVMPKVEAFLALPRATLFDAVFASMQLALECFAIPTRLVLQSSLDYDRGLKRGELVLALAQAAGATCYLSGTGAQAYLEESAFGTMALRYDRFVHPEYPQKNASAFVPGLSCLDLLFNVGCERARSYLGLAVPASA